MEGKVFVESVTIENFKSIKKLTLDLKPGVTLLVGPNGAGKTNILEAIYFLYEALVEAPMRIPYMPHAPGYWSPLDLVYGRDPNRRVKYTLQLRYTVKTDDGKVLGYRPVFSVEFMVVPGYSTIVPVRFEVDHEGYTRLVFMTDRVEVYVKKDLVDEMWDLIPPDVKNIISEYKEVDEYKTFTLKHRGEGTPANVPAALNPFNVWSLPFRCKPFKGWHACISMMQPFFTASRPFPIFFKMRKLKNEDFRGFNTSIIRDYALEPAAIYLMLNRVMLLKHPDIGALREPKPLAVETNRLDPRATNLAPVLLALMGKTGMVPWRIQNAVSKLFPGTQLKLEPHYGRIAIQAVEGNLELPPPNMADGLLKLLSILAAVELEPSMLLIDEIENSMHARMLEYVLDELNSLEVPVLVATHSPIVVDLVGPGRTLVVRKDPTEGTVVEAFSDPGALSRRLEELGVTFSDYIFYSRTRGSKD